ncbi:MAK10-like protein [Tanacetum coccineum]
MGDANPIHTLGDYSRPSHEGYRNTIELSEGNNVDLALYDNGNWNDPMDFAKPVKAISLPQDVPSTSDCCLIELENQVQLLMEAHIAPIFNNQSNLKGLVSNFMASQDARLSKFEADFKQQQSDMTNKIDTVLKAITDRMAGALPSDTVKNPKLNVNSTSLVLSARGKPFLEKPAVNRDEDWNTTNRRPKPTLEDEFHDLHLNLLVLEVLAHVPIYNTMLDKYLNIRLLEETDHIFRLADRTKSYRVGIVKDVEVHIGKLKLLNDFYVIDMKKDPETPLLVGRGFLATANAVIDFRKAKIAVGEGITRSVFRVKGVDLGEEEAPYWTTLGKRKEWEIARDAEINHFKDALVFRRMVEFLGAIPINLKRNMWESEALI